MTKIDISHYVECTRVLGPYERSALWVHGCCFNCEGCIAKEMNLQESKEVNTAELIELFAGIRDAEGITISGGEPFLQAEHLGTHYHVIARRATFGGPPRNDMR